MITKMEIKKILSSFNLEVSSYGPTIYNENYNLGITLDIKDSLFGYLTRAFLFDNTAALEEFLKKYIWYKNNHRKYHITLALDNYETKTPQLRFLENNKELTLNDMLEYEKHLEDNKKADIEENKKNIYLLNIENLTKYLINLKNINYQNNITKNNLKTTENDLKFELLNNLANYYGRTKSFDKKVISLDNLVLPTTEINTLNSNLLNIQNKNNNDLQNYLETLIKLIKEEELNDKYILNTYSNSVYNYNIDILKKQIDFVKNKITAEKNFNLRGSKIHNIDEELKSFLKTSVAPPKLDTFLANTKNAITQKYDSISNIEEAYSKISGNILNLPTLKNNKKTFNNSLKNLKDNFNNLDDTTKINLILYNSFYKNVINYIIENNYPDLDIIKKTFDFSYYYNTIDEIIHNEQNSHYQIQYFKTINFKNLDTYLSSLINIAKSLEQTSFTLNDSIQVFSLNLTTKYREYTLNPIYNNNTDLITIEPHVPLIYIPEKLEINEEEKEITTITTDNIYCLNNILPTNEKIIVSKYNKTLEKDLKNGIIITTKLTLNNQTTFNLGTIKGE